MNYQHALCVSWLSVAGEAFCKAAELQLALGSKHEGATHYVDAGNCYRKGDATGKILFWQLPPVI